MTVSLIISTYNRADALRLCLLSVLNQTVMPSEIIIGDDGSLDDTRSLIEEMKKLFTIPVIHVWQEDKGFRLAMMRNKSVAASSGEYIIEIDGDLILHPRFVEDHLAVSSPGHYIKGGRCNLGQGLTEKLCTSGSLQPLRWWTRGIESKAENAIRMMSVARWLAPRYRRHKETALGCNMSFYRKDFIAINGYDEFYEGWGGEDYDFGRRLQALGLKKLHLKFCGIVFHLWHEDKFMQNKSLNLGHSHRSDISVRCENGVSQYL